MKERYIRRVKRALHAPRKRKMEVARDLEEIFASAMEHGETEQQVIARLGTPKEFADGVSGNFADKKQREIGLIVLLTAAAAAAFAVYAAANAARVPDGVIGQTDAMTNIRIAGTLGLDVSKLILALGVLAAAFAAVRIVRMVRGRRRER